MSISRDFIFNKKEGFLTFVGDFEAFYTHEKDPWDQSGDTGEMAPYYAHSRRRLVSNLKKHDPSSILEVGCGLGFSSNFIKMNLPSADVTGMDISQTAIDSATKNFRNCQFKQGSILKEPAPQNHYDCIILSQLLWYIIHDFSTAMNNCLSYLNPNGVIIITQAFLKGEQLYAKDFCDGFKGLLSLLESDFSEKLTITFSDYDEQDNFIHHDGLIILSPKM
tara:strand:- start:62902 stop:63564 length:663 start_codon:yes stop_codon:yes gene_type:complete